MPLASQLPLPGEVTDAIIDHLHDDERSLRRCAVVCHSWLPGSRYHLFYTIKVRNSARAQSLAEFLAANPDIASFIQHLDLRGPPERWNHETLQFTELEGLLPLLPSIRFLSIFNMILVEPAGGQGGGAQPVTTLSLGSLVELSVEGSSNLFWGDNPLIFRLLGFFPSISRVRLLTSSHPHSVDPISTGLPANHTTIAHLATRDVPLSVVTNLVCRSRTAETLQTFWYDDHRLDWPNAGELCMFFAELCRGAKSSIHRVIFGPTDLIYPMRYKIEDDSDFLYRNPLITVPSEDPVPDWPALNLARCTKLSLVSIRASRLLEYHIGLFASLPESVRVIHFTFVGLPTPVWTFGTNNHWAQIDEAFCAGICTRLTLVLDLSRARRTINPDRYQRFKGNVEQSLPRLMERGRLVITESPPEWWKLG